jgi:hypothetical protein
MEKMIDCDCCLASLPTRYMEHVDLNEGQTMVICRHCYQMFYESGFQEYLEVRDEFSTLENIAGERF